jgi:hypothetical protein
VGKQVARGWRKRESKDWEERESWGKRGSKRGGIVGGEVGVKEERGYMNLGGGVRRRRDGMG